MSDVTRILSEIEAGSPVASDQLLPLVYEELRKLAAARLAQEKPGQTLQATALVHEAYLRLVDVEAAQRWNSKGHFFAAAAEAMRRIVVEQARRRQRLKHGGGREREVVSDIGIAIDEPMDELLDLDVALARLEVEEPEAAKLVKLRYFAGLTVPQTAEAMGVSPRKANFLWAFARAWLRRELAG